MNSLVLVGRILEMNESLTEKNRVDFTLSINRNYKNEEGIYETDFIKCKCFDSIANNFKEWLKKGDLVGIKGTLQSENGVMIVLVERLTFLSTRKEDE